MCVLLPLIRLLFYDGGTAQEPSPPGFAQRAGHAELQCKGRTPVSCPLELQTHLFPPRCPNIIIPKKACQVYLLFYCAVCYGLVFGLCNLCHFGVGNSNRAGVFRIYAASQSPVRAFLWRFGDLFRIIPYSFLRSGTRFPIGKKEKCCMSLFSLPLKERKVRRRGARRVVHTVIEVGWKYPPLAYHGET